MYPSVAVSCQIEFYDVSDPEEPFQSFHFDTLAPWIPTVGQAVTLPKPTLEDGQPVEGWQTWLVTRVGLEYDRRQGARTQHTYVVAHVYVDAPVDIRE